MCLEDRPILEPKAAGIDIGSREIFVAVPPDRDPNPVRVFPTFTENLQELAAWLAVWCDHRGHGKHGGILDSALRHFAAARNPAMPSKRSTYEERARAAYRLA